MQFRKIPDQSSYFEIIFSNKSYYCSQQNEPEEKKYGKSTKTSISVVR